MLLHEQITIQKYWKVSIYASTLEYKSYKAIEWPKHVPVADVARCLFISMLSVLPDLVIALHKSKVNNI